MIQNYFLLIFYALGFVFAGLFFGYILGNGGKKITTLFTGSSIVGVIVSLWKNMMFIWLVASFLLGTKIGHIFGKKEFEKKTDKEYGEELQALDTGHEFL